MRDETRDAILEHARADFPREACGLILNIKGKELYRPCRNIASSNGDFIIDPLDFAKAEDEGQILQVVHSHCNQSAKPSQTDLVSCESSGFPWVIVALPSETWHEFSPSGYKAPLLGRQYSHGVLDCFSFLKDWYLENLGIELPDFDRPDEWWTKGLNLYMENYEKAGFYPVDQPEYGDIIIMNIASKVPNHGAVYIGNGMIAHHPQGRLSCRELFGGYWAKCARVVVRYKKK
jgi:proteasome lid subunit RPN8/RPN11